MYARARSVGVATITATAFWDLSHHEQWGVGAEDSDVGTAGVFIAPEYRNAALIMSSSGFRECGGQLEVTSKMVQLPDGFDSLLFGQASEDV